jgi:hypothetical protein
VSSSVCSCGPRGVPSAILQTRIVLTVLPLASMPSPSTTRAFTKSVWPSSSAESSPLRRSWQRMTASSPARPVRTGDHESRDVVELGGLQRKDVRAARAVLLRRACAQLLATEGRERSSVRQAPQAQRAVLVTAGHDLLAVDDRERQRSHVVVVPPARRRGDTAGRCGRVPGPDGAVACTGDDDRPAVEAADPDLQGEEHVDPLQSDAQSTWKKFTAGMVEAWLRRNLRDQVSVARSGAGGIPRSLSTLRIVEAPTRCPSWRNSPWMRW